MKPRIIIVHNDPIFVQQTVAGMRTAGYDVSEFHDPLSAYNALENEPIAVLITRIRFPVGRSNGISLALMARIRQPGIQIIFTGSADYRDYAKGLGTFLTLPVTPKTVVTTVNRMLCG